MSGVVVDAGVAAKWFLPVAGESLVPRAAGLLSRFSRGEIRLLVPGIFWAEVGNLLWKAVNQARCTREFALSALRTVQDLDLPTVPNSVILEKAFEISLDFGRSVYDCLYVALALQSSAVFITADERLSNALAAYFPVKWLGSF